MTVLMARENRANLWLSIAAVACFALAAASSVTALDVVGGVPLVLVLPGWATLFAVDPDETVLGADNRWLWRVALSIGCAVLGGILLDQIAGLDRDGWLSYFGVWIALGAGIGWLRTASQWNRGASVRISPTNGMAESAQQSRATRRISPTSIGLLLLAACLCVGSLAFSQRSVTSSAPSVLELWVVPGGGRHSDQATVGLRNDSAKDVKLVVRVAGSTQTGNEAIMEVTLKPQGTWASTYERRTGTSLQASVSYAGDPATLVRRVFLAGST